MTLSLAGRWLPLKSPTQGGSKQPTFRKRPGAGGPGSTQPHLFCKTQQLLGDLSGVRGELLWLAEGPLLPPGRVLPLNPGKQVFKYTSANSRQPQG